MRRYSIMLIAALGLAACGRDDLPGAEPETATLPAQLPADSAAQLPAPADHAATENVPESAQDAPGVPEAPRGQRPSPRPNGSSGPVQDPAPVEPARSAEQTTEILQRASTAYGRLRSLRADFVMTREIPALRQTITSRGRLYQRSPDLLALRFTEPDGDVIVSDGRDFWVYYPSVNADQVMRFPAIERGRSGVDLQAQFVGNPTERFDATLHGRETVGGRTTDVLTLVPRQRAEYRSLKVWLDTRDSLARRFEIVEHNGTSRLFDLSDIQPNATIPDATFRFTPPAGARVVSGG